MLERYIENVREHIIVSRHPSEMFVDVIVKFRTDVRLNRDVIYPQSGSYTIFVILPGGPAPRPVEIA